MGTYFEFLIFDRVIVFDGFNLSAIPFQLETTRVSMCTENTKGVKAVKLSRTMETPYISKRFHKISVSYLDY